MLVIRSDVCTIIRFLNLGPAVGQFGSLESISRAKNSGKQRKEKHLSKICKENFLYEYDVFRVIAF